MEKVFNSVKTGTGVSLDWMDGKRTRTEQFSFHELDEMRIRVPDLISRPELFRIDLQEHKIYPQAVKWYVEGKLKVEGRIVKVLKSKPRGRVLLGR